MNALRIFLRVALPVLVVGLAALGALLLARGGEVPSSTPTEPFVPLVRTIRAEARPVRLSVGSRGTVVPRTESRLVSEVAARVVHVCEAFEEGATFEAGELLLELDPTDHRLAESEADARVAAARLALAQELADAEVARADWESRRSESPPSALVLREPQVEHARAELEAALAAQAKARRDVDRCRVRAPFTGRTRRRSVDLGEYVVSGTELGLVYAVDWAEVRLPVPDADLARLDLAAAGAAARSATDDLDDNERAREGRGPRVELTTSFAGSKRRWLGEIVRVEGEIDAQSRMVGLVARIGGGRDALPMPGLFVEAQIEGRWLESAIVLPDAALQPGGRVFVLDENDRLAIRAVTLVEVRPDEAVLADGIEPGERVVVSPIELAVEGMPLREHEDTEGSSR